MPLAAGAKLGPYEILAPIGAGGMGEVYKARDTRLDRVVALKVSKEEFSERFEHEARTIAQLNHPNICQLHDVGPNYLVMEFVEGTPLEGPLPLDQAVEHAGQILEALDAAHRKGITHRDLKPANILVTRQGIKLLDFGLAKFATAPLAQSDETVTRALTQQGQIVGTLQYMSPEQLQGKPADPRSDLFSFGCVLYEMLSGMRAFEGQSAADVIGAILEREPSSLSVAPALDRVVRRCLAKDPDQRFQTARDLKTALLWAVEQPQGAAAQPTKQSILSWALPWAAAAIATLAAVAFAAMWLMRPQPVAVTAQFNLEPPPGVVFNYLITANAISPDGRFLVFRGGGESGVPALWLRPLDSLSARRLGGTEGADFPFWSPDSKSIAFFAGGKLKKLDIVGGTPLALCDAIDGMAGAEGVWNRNRTILFGDKRGLFLISESGGTPAPLIKADASRQEGGYGYPQFLPDGKHFLYFIGSSDPAVEGVYAASLDRPQDRIPVLRAPAKAVYAPPLSGQPGYLLFLRERALFAQRFDAGELRVEGDPILLAPDLAVLPSLRSAAFWLSDTGILVYRTGLALEKVKLVWANRDGKRMGEAAPEGPYTSLRLSPDGKRVAFGRRNASDPSDLWILQFERGMMTRLTFDPQADTCPVWSSDGRQIAFASSRTGIYQIYRKDAGGAGPEEQLTNNPQAKCTVDWSRDGRYLLYREQAGNSSDLWALPLDGGKPAPVVQTPFDEADGQFSPDGKWIAYTSDESGRYEVYVRTYQGSDSGPVGKWQVSNIGGRAPRWRADGKELFYLALDGRKMMAAGIQTTARGLEAGASSELFVTSVPGDVGDNAYPYDVTADGQRFLTEEPSVSQSSSPLTVVVNWQAGLKR